MTFFKIYLRISQIFCPLTEHSQSVTGITYWYIVSFVLLQVCVLSRRNITRSLIV